MAKTKRGLLSRVRRAATRSTEAFEDRNAAILEAHAGGATVRAIAEEAGLSFQRVHQIIKENA
jgi:DNA-binding NarL/FixJ family response regulator